MVPSPLQAEVKRGLSEHKSRPSFRKKKKLANFTCVGGGRGGGGGGGGGDNTS